MKRTFIGVLVLLFAACTGSLTLSQELEVVPISGGTPIILSLDDLRGLGETELRTGNDFVDGERRFRGPLVRDVLHHAGAENTTLVRLTAANDYQVEIAAEEFMQYEVILALSMDGVPLSMRDKGPIWVIYPISENAELQDPVYNNRLIWQLVKLEYQ